MAWLCAANFRSCALVPLQDNETIHKLSSARFHPSFFFDYLLRLSPLLLSLFLSLCCLSSESTYPFENTRKATNHLRLLPLYDFYPHRQPYFYLPLLSIFPPWARFSNIYPRRSYDVCALSFHPHTRISITLMQPADLSVVLSHRVLLWLEKREKSIVF